MWSPSTGVDEALKVLTRHSLKPLHLKPKEGLALINGTQLITALGAEAVNYYLIIFILVEAAYNI